MTMRKSLLACLLAIGSGAALADTLLLDGIELEAQSAETRPARGMTMARVESRFGAPSERRSAIGEPPISRWEYPGFTVFFEHDHVIHTVARR